MAAKKLKTFRAVKTIKRKEEDVLPKGVDGKWLVPGSKTAVFETTTARGKVLLAQKAAVELNHGMVMLDSEQDAVDLPKDFPHRDVLAAHGLKTVDSIRTYPDLTSVPGIGEIYAQQVIEALHEIDGGDEDVDEDDEG